MSQNIERHSHISITRRTAGGVMHTDVHITEVAPDDCFDPASCCDEQEQALIAALRAYLRPVQAPESLRQRLRATLDHCCEEECQHSGR